MIVIYFIVLAIIVVMGFFLMCYIGEDGAFDDLFPDDSETLGFIKIISMFTAASWLTGIFWPLIVASIVPVLVVTGIVFGVRETTKAVRKHREDKVKKTDV